MVQNSKGNILRRNRKHLLPTEEKYDKLGDEIDELWPSNETSYGKDLLSSMIPDTPTVASESEVKSKDALEGSLSFTKQGNLDSSDVKRTRSGRTLRQPSYLSDYSLK